jgi:hypothetical protein
MAGHAPISSAAAQWPAASNWRRELELVTAPMSASVFRRASLVNRNLYPLARASSLSAPLAPIGEQALIPLLITFDDGWTDNEQGHG